MTLFGKVSDAIGWIQCTDPLSCIPALEQAWALHAVDRQPTLHDLIVMSERGDEQADAEYTHP